MLTRHDPVALSVVLACLLVGVALAPALGLVGTAHASTDDARLFQATTNGANATGNETRQSNASITLENQTTTGTTVTVASVTLPSAGFVTIHNRSYKPPENDTVGSIIGASTYLAAGHHENVTVVLRRTLDSNATVTAVANRDGNGNQNFDYATENGFIDTAFGRNGSPVTDEGVVSVRRLPAAGVGSSKNRPGSPAVMVENQMPINNRLVVRSVALPTYSFVVVHNGSYNDTEPTNATVIGRTQKVRIGAFENLTIELYNEPDREFDPERLNGTGTVYVGLYRDTNQNGEFDFRNLSEGTDAPYLNASGLPIVERVTITAGNGSGTATATVHTPESTPNTRSTAVTTTLGGISDGRGTTGAAREETGMPAGSGGGADNGGNDLTPFLLVGAVAAVLLVGWFVVASSRTDGSAVGALGREAGRVRMALGQRALDVRAYGLPADWRTLEIDLSMDDSPEQKRAVAAFAGIEGLDVAPDDESDVVGGEPDESAENGFHHRDMTISLSRETVERAATAAEEDDEHSRVVIQALRDVLSAYAPDAVRATTASDGS